MAAAQPGIDSIQAPESNEAPVRTFTASYYDSLVAVSTTKGMFIRSFKEGEAQELCFVCDGLPQPRAVAFQRPYLFVGGAAGVVTAFHQDQSGGHLAGQIPLQDVCAHSAKSPEELVISCIAAHPSRKLLAIACDRTVCVFDTSASAIEGAFEARLVYSDVLHEAPVHGLKWLGEGGQVLLAIAAAGLVGWQCFPSGVDGADTSVNKLPDVPQLVSQNAAACAATQQKVAGCSGNLVEVMQFSKYSFTRRNSGSEGRDEESVVERLSFETSSMVEMVEFDASGSRLVTATRAHDGGGSVVTLWEVADLPAEKGRGTLCLGHQPRAHITCLAFQPDGRLLATGGTDGRVLVFDASETGMQCKEPQSTCLDYGAADPITALCWLPGGVLVAGTSKGKIETCTLPGLAPQTPAKSKYPISVQIEALAGVLTSYAAAVAGDLGHSPSSPRPATIDLSADDSASDFASPSQQPAQLPLLPHPHPHPNGADEQNPEPASAALKPNNGDADVPLQPSAGLGQQQQAGLGGGGERGPSTRGAPAAVDVKARKPAPRGNPGRSTLLPLPSSSVARRPGEQQGRGYRAPPPPPLAARPSPPSSTLSRSSSLGHSPSGSPMLHSHRSAGPFGHGNRNPQQQNAKPGQRPGGYQARGQAEGGRGAGSAASAAVQRTIMRPVPAAATQFNKPALPHPQDLAWMLRSQPPQAAFPGSMPGGYPPYMPRPMYYPVMQMQHPNMRGFQWYPPTVPVPTPPGTPGSQPQLGSPVSPGVRPFPAQYTGVPPPGMMPYMYHMPFQMSYPAAHPGSPATPGSSSAPHSPQMLPPPPMMLPMPMSPPHAMVGGVMGGGPAGRPGVGMVPIPGTGPGPRGPGGKPVSRKASPPPRGIQHVVYIGNLLPSVTDEMLEQALLATGQCHNISAVQVIRDRPTGTSKCFAFVDFKTVPDADAAMNYLNFHIVKDVHGKPMTNSQNGTPQPMRAWPSKRFDQDAIKAQQQPPSGPRSLAGGSEGAGSSA